MDENGIKHYTFEVYADRLEFVERKDNSTLSSAQDEEYIPYDEDLPFNWLPWNSKIHFCPTGAEVEEYVQRRNIMDWWKKYWILCGIVFYDFDLILICSVIIKLISYIG